MTTYLHTPAQINKLAGVFVMRRIVRAAEEWVESARELDNLKQSRLGENFWRGDSHSKSENSSF